MVPILHFNMFKCLRHGEDVMIYTIVLNRIKRLMLVLILLSFACAAFAVPIELKDAKTEKEVLEAQKNYLEKNFPGYQVISRATWVFGKKFIDRVRLEKEDDTRVLMFDVSAHINEYRKTHEINLKEIAPGMISVQK